MAESPDGILYSKYFSSIDPQWQMNRDDPEIWQMVDEIPDKALWEEHVWLKQKLFNRIREKKRIKWESQLNEPSNLVAEGLMLNPSVLTIGFARRFSAYKRADLIFHDKIRLRRILNNPWRPVQIIFPEKHILPIMKEKKSCNGYTNLPSSRNSAAGSDLSKITGNRWPSTWFTAWMSG